MKKIEDWEREEAQERRLEQLLEWLDHRPLLGRLYCYLIIKKLGLTTPATVFPLLWMMFFVFMAVVMALICLLMAG